MESQKYDGYLTFDNLNFKLAVLQELVYRKRLLQWDNDTEWFLQK